MLARVNQRARVGHDADMAGEEDQVAPLELVASYVGFGTERSELEVAVARQLHAGGAPRTMVQTRTVDAIDRTPAPEIRTAERRVGRAGVSKGRSRRSAQHQKKKKKTDIKTN